jgi:glycosyltransferase 2 family protein
MRISRNALLRATIGIAVSVVALWILVQSVDIPAALAVLGTASPAWIAVMLVTTTIDIGARGARWRALLAPIAPLRYRRVLGYTYIGYLANNVLPARLGELYRSHALGEGEGVSRTTVLGTVVVERVVDTVMVVAIAAVAVLVLSVRGVMSSAVLLGLAFVSLAVIALGLGIAAHRLPGADRATAMIARRPRLLELARRLRDGLAVAGRPRTIATAVVFSAIAWAASTGTFLAAGQAVGVELSVAQAALLCSGVALVSIVPSGPGYVGTFELTVVGIADGFGIPRDSAFALGLLVHVMILATTTIGGIAAMLAFRRREAAAGQAAERLAEPGGEPAP